MARPKSFDREEALDQAMQVFWTHGYEATTMTSLRLAMGLGRQSLYDTFGDKNQLFAEALERYMRFNDADVVTFLDEGDAIDGIRALFEARVSMLSEGVRRGCLMINTCVERSPHDPATAAQIDVGLGTLRDGFESALRRAAADGQLSADSDVSTLAHFLTSQVAGMVVMAKNDASEAELRGIADTALSTLTR